MKLTTTIIFTVLSLNISTYGNIQKVTTKNLTSLTPLEKEFKKELSKSQLLTLKNQVLDMKGKSVTTLIKVMKDGSYPDKNRWMATFLLGQVMGIKSAEFISKFTTHPDWIMRMASLKTLSALKQTKYKEQYKELLSDSSMLVRYQALETVKNLGLSELAPNVWAMLYDKKNYHINEKTKGTKRTHIVKNIIKTVGDLKFEKAKKPLLSMILQDKYKDIHIEIDQTLAILYNKKSPNGDLAQKINFWKKVKMSETVI